LDDFGREAVAAIADLRISQPTRFRPTGTVNPRRSSGALAGA
jgi:hypothetical protein